LTDATIPVFAGPSLPERSRPQGPFDWRSPASAGDLIRLADRPPAKLCLIDGFFDSRPAPWHKEILTLMTRGTIVFGASSMGALRAAELHPFGMIGVGAIFEAYAAGRLTGDDEVALIHASDALGWTPLSVPMVELRATLIAACRASLIDVDTARRLRCAGHAIHFADRDWPALAKVFVGEGHVESATAQRLQALHVPLKHQDARDCLAVALAWSEPARASPPPPDTIFIRRLVEETRQDGSALPPCPKPPERCSGIGRQAPAEADGGA
jgi:hypothetical protein